MAKCQSLARDRASVALDPRELSARNQGLDQALRSARMNWTRKRRLSFALETDVTEPSEMGLARVVVTNDFH